MAVLVFGYRFALYSRTVFAIYAVILVVLLIGSRSSFRLISDLIRRRRHAGERVVVYGAGDVGVAAMRQLFDAPQARFRMVGFIDDDRARHGRRVHGYVIHGGYEQIVALIDAGKVDAVVLAAAPLDASASDRTQTPLRIERSHPVAGARRHRAAGRGLKRFRPIGHVMTTRAERQAGGGARPIIVLGLFLARKVADVHFGLSCVRAFAVRRQWRDAVRSLRFVVDPIRPGPRAPAEFRKRARRLQRWRRASPARRITSALFGAVAAPDAVIWIAPHDVAVKTSHDLSLYANDILPGDWDRESAAIEDLVKHRSIVRRYRDGVRWADTELFAYYARVLDNGEAVKGLRDLAAVGELFETWYDDVFASLRKDGFRVLVARDGWLHIPHVHIGRGGEILYGGAGNHRLMMARVLGIERIPCYVHARHLEWQRIRERVAALGPDRWRDEADPRLADHPDLADLLGRAGATAEAHLDVTAASIPSLYRTWRGLLLRRLGRATRDGTAVVHVGCWLGAGTAQLVQGIRERSASGDVRLHAYDVWRATAWDVKRAARRGISLAAGEDLLPRVRRTLEPFGVPVELAREVGADGGWAGGPISLYVDEGSARLDLRARGVERCAGSWIPGETVVVFVEEVGPAGGVPAECTLEECVVGVDPECFTLLEETERCRVFRYAALADVRRLAAAARVWSLSVAVRTRERELRDLRQSTSWRATAPLRWIGNLGRRAPRYVRSAPA